MLQAMRRLASGLKGHSDIVSLQMAIDVDFGVEEDSAIKNARMGVRIEPRAKQQ